MIQQSEVDPTGLSSELATVTTRAAQVRPQTSSDEPPPKTGVSECGRILGERYSDVKLAQWVWSKDSAEAKRQQAVIEWLKRATELSTDAKSAHLKNLTGNVVFVGPPGTGKDMLMAWLVRIAISEKKSVEWFNGPNLFAKTRDRIRDDASEMEFLKRIRALDLLCLSDPVPPGGKLETTHQVSWLYRVIDERYRACKPTFCTLNVSDGKEAEDKLTPQIWDRLIDGAHLVRCFWKSYRKQTAVIG